MKTRQLPSFFDDNVLLTSWKNLYHIYAKDEMSLNPKSCDRFHFQKFNVYEASGSQSNQMLANLKTKMERRQRFSNHVNYEELNRESSH